MNSTIQTLSNLEQEEIDILFHTLGLNYESNPYRNFFGVGKNNPDYVICTGLVDKGYMIKFSSLSFIPDEEYIFQIKSNKINEIILLKNLIVEEMLIISKAKKRYQHFIKLRDTFPDLTMKTFLTDNFFIKYQKDNNIY